jgi:hypothetical protein
LYLFIPIATATDTAPTARFNLVNDFAAKAAIFFNLFVYEHEIIYPIYSKFHFEYINNMYGYSYI